MSNASDHLEYLLSQSLFQANNFATALTTSAGIYVGLYIVAPTDTGGSTEVSTTAGYARALTSAVNWTMVTAGTITAKNTSAMIFAANTGTAYTVTDVAFHNHETATAFTNYLMRGALSANVLVPAGDQFQFLASALIVTIS